MASGIFYTSAFTVIVLLFSHFSSADINANRDYYIAAAVEFAPEDDLNLPEKIVESNLNGYLEIFDMAKNKNIDILVFPEATLNYHGLETRTAFLEQAIVLPNPEQNIAPCDHSNYSDVLRTLSRKAKEHRMYVLVNLVEKAPCGRGTERTCRHPYKSQNDGYDIFNTNIVFDRQGRVISRYRKINLFQEPFMDVPITSELATFTTDFNVKFGHFICFDILFKDPAIRLLREENITNILFPAMWFSDMPFLTAEQIHQGWAYGNNVNLISAGSSLPSRGSTGSGIYIGNQAIADILLSPKPTRKLLIARVPNDPRTSRSKRIIETASQGHPSIVQMDSLRLSTIWTAEKVHKFDIVNETQSVCAYDDICCEFKINAKHYELPVGKITYRYMLVANYTTRIYGENRQSGELYCAILACSTNNPNSCGRRFQDSRKFVNTVEFEKLRVKAKVKLNQKDSSELLVMPNTLDASIYPLETTAYTFQRSGIYTEARLSTEILKKGGGFELFENFTWLEQNLI